MKQLACLFSLAVGLCRAVAHVTTAQRATEAHLTRLWSGTDQTTTQSFYVDADTWNLEWTIEGNERAQHNWFGATYRLPLFRVVN